MIDEGMIDTSIEGAQKINPGTHLVGWSTTPGEFSFIVQRLIAGTTTTFDGKLDASKVGTIDGVQRTETFVNLSIKKRTYGLVL